MCNIYLFASALFDLCNKIKISDSITISSKILSFVNFSLLDVININ